MRVILLFLFLNTNAFADDFLGCTFSVNQNNQMITSQHLTANRAHQLWSWKNYRFSLRYQQRDFIELEMDPIRGLRTWVKQTIVSDQKFFRLLIDDAGYMFLVSCIYLEE